MLSQLLILFGFFSLVLVSVYWVNRAIRIFDNLIGGGQTAWVFLEFTMLTLPYVILVVLPIAAFVAAIYVTNRLSAESEMVVLQTSGASSARIARPVFYFGVIVALLVAALAHLLVPAARTELAWRSQEVSQDITARFLKEGQFLHPSTNITVYIQRITPLGEFQELFLEDKRDPMAQVTYTAETALLVPGDDGPRLVMSNGLAQTFRPETGRLSTVTFDNFAYDIGGLMDPSTQRLRDLAELPTPILLNPSEQDLANSNGTRASFLAEAHGRFARSLLSIFVPMMGFAALLIGGFSRFGVWKQVVGAVVLIILVQMAANTTEEIARGDASLWWTIYLAPAMAAALSFILIAISSAQRLRNPFRRDKEVAA